MRVSSRVKRVIGYIEDKSIYDRPKILGLLLKDVERIEKRLSSNIKQIRIIRGELNRFNPNNIMLETSLSIKSNEIILKMMKKEDINKEEMIRQEGRIDILKRIYNNLKNSSENIYKIKGEL